MASSPPSRRKCRRVSTHLQNSNSVRPGQWNKKVWKFSKIRKLKELAFIHEREALRAKGDNILDLFLPEHSAVSHPYFKIREFCRTWPVPSDCSTAPTIQPEPARAWVYIRSQPGGHIHGPNLLTSDQLCTTLKEFTPSSDTASYRHLIHISQLDPDFILTLAKTALHHQVEALRDAIYKHVTAATSIRVHLPMRGFQIFRLELHLCRLALKEVDISKRPGQCNTTTHHVLSDLSFLNLTSASGKPRDFVIKKSPFSMVVCGWDDTKWTAYAFGNRAQTDDDDDDDDDDGDDGGDDAGDDGNEKEGDDQEEQDDAEIEPNEDVIVSDPTQFFSTNQSPTDPRLYWVTVFESEGRMMLGDWTHLVDMLEDSVERWKVDRGPTVERTVKAMKLFSELRSKLSACLWAWDAFVRHGDINYFSNIRVQKAMLAFDSIKETFTKLAELEQKLNSLYIYCQEAATTIGLEMNHESHRVHLESYQVTVANNRNAVQMLSTTQIVTPIVIVTGYFSTQEQVFGFRRDARSFLVCLLVVFIVLQALNLMTLPRWKGMLAGTALGRRDPRVKGKKVPIDEESQQEHT